MSDRYSAARPFALLLVAALAAPAAALAQARPARPSPRPAAARAKKAPTKAEKEATQALFAAVDAFIPTVSDIEAALKAGADVNGQNDEGWTPLMVASKKMNQDAIKALLAAKASPNLKTKRGATALMMACSEDRWMVIPLLLGAGADVKAQDDGGWTPLVHCASTAGESSMKALLEAGADKDHLTKDGVSPLYVALAEGRGSAARTLLKAGAKAVPEKNKDGFGLLSIAVISADPDAVRVALKMKPDVNARSAEGHTALMIASDFGYPEMVADLLRAKADARLTDSKGRTAFDFAKARDHAEVVAMLTGQWTRPKLPGTTLSVPCEKLGGPVDVNLQPSAGTLGVTITYPRPVSLVLGGFYDEPDRYGYKDWSADVHLYFDTDANAKTGATADVPTEQGARGAEYELGFSEISTSVQVPFADGQKTVSGHVLSPSFSKKGGSGPDPLSGEGFYPKARNEAGVVKSEVPLSALGVAPGTKVRVTAEVGLCSRKEATLQLK